MPEDKTLPLLRRELAATEQVYDGQPYWVIKDPISLRYYRFNREEYFIINQLRRGVTIKELKEAHRGEFRTHRLTNDEVGKFVGNLISKNLVMMNHPHRDELLYQAGKKKWRAKFTGQLTNLMFFKIPLFDPDRLLARMVEPIRFLWTRTFFMIYVLGLMLALTLILRRWNDFSGMFSSHFFTIYNMPILIVVVWLIKGLHEFGHGLTCKNYGGEVHEMGWLFLVFMPFFYCNVTDSWTFRVKSQRILVTAGGIMTELIFASVAAVIWYFTDPPGFLHTLTFNIVVACSLSTILFNANPLLRFDGYYILMDLIEVPNLRQRANNFVKRFLVRNILGGRSGQEAEEHRFRFVFPLYAVSAYVYRWFILFAILFMVYGMFDRLRLVWLGRLVVTFSILTMLVYPTLKGAAGIVRYSRTGGVSNVRLMILLAVLLLAVGAVLFYPAQQHVTLNFILEPSRMQWLRSDVDGQFAWSAEGIDADGEIAMRPIACEGALIGEGVDDEIIARLENPQLRLSVTRVTAEMKQLNIRMAQARTQGRSSEAEQCREMLAERQGELRRLNEQIANLSVRAPFVGRVLSRDMELKELADRYVPRGAPLLLLGDTTELAAKVWVPEKMFARIFRGDHQLNQGAELMLYAFSQDKFRGKVSKVSTRREEDMGEFGEKLALSNKVGGEVLTEYDPVTEQEEPVEPVYEVTIALDEDSMPGSARAYMSGRVRIDCGRSTLYQWGRDSLLRFIAPEVRL